MIKDAVLKVPYENLDSDLLDTLFSKLTLDNPAYKNFKRFGGYYSTPPPKHSFFFKEFENYVAIPRNYPLKSTVSDETNEGLFADIMFTKTLRDYQESFYKQVILDKPTDFILAMPCGTGKTTMGIYAASLLKRKTLVFVPTNFLLEQWDLRVSFFTDKKALKIISLVSLDTFFSNSNEYDICLITFDMYNSINFKSNGTIVKLLNMIGVVIFDEAHRTGADTYYPILSEIPAKYRIALSATFRRQDDRQEILKYHFGKVYALPRVFDKTDIYPLVTTIDCEGVYKKPTKKVSEEFLKHIDEHSLWQSPQYVCLQDSFFSIPFTNEKHLKTLQKNKVKDSSASEVLSCLSENPYRFRALIKVLTELLDKQRNILVLSRRKTILKNLHNHFSKKFRAQLVIAETSKKVSGEIKQDTQITFGIMQLAEEGLDAEHLDTLVLLNPISDMEQAIGRIQRYKEGKLRTAAFVILDNVPIMHGLFKKSRIFVANNATLKEAQSIKEPLPI